LLGAAEGQVGLTRPIVGRDFTNNSRYRDRALAGMRVHMPRLYRSGQSEGTPLRVDSLCSAVIGSTDRLARRVLLRPHRIFGKPSPNTVRLVEPPFRMTSLPSSRFPPSAAWPLVFPTHSTTSPFSVLLLMHGPMPGACPPFTHVQRPRPRDKALHKFLVHTLVDRPRLAAVHRCPDVPTANGPSTAKSRWASS